VPSVAVGFEDSFRGRYSGSRDLPTAGSRRLAPGSYGSRVAKGPRSGKISRLLFGSLGPLATARNLSKHEEMEVKKFMLLMYGFEKPTPEIMDAWKAWFESIADITVDQGGFHGGALEISASGTKDLPMGMESITGYTIIEAESLAEAEKVARENPYIASIRVYEIMGAK
jgi:hypothetical protein